MLWQISRLARFGWLSSPVLGRCAFLRQAGKRRLDRTRLTLRERNLRRYLKRRPMLHLKGHINTIRNRRQRPVRH